MDCQVIIPARIGSQRFPGKALALLRGKPLIACVVERALAAQVGPVSVATDDTAIARAAEQAGARACMTRSDHVSGTDRVAEVAADLGGNPVICNLQGDEPLFEPAVLRSVVERCERVDAVMATAAVPLTEAELDDPNAVKVVVDARGRALYFSRAAIPAGAMVQRRRHLGIYAYRRRTLLWLAATPAVELERVERLEQLRALYYGVAIHVVDVERAWRGVDTPEDLARLEAELEQARETT